MPDHSDSHIKIIDAYENNLKHISVAIPKNKLVIFAGVSGSGKSSLVFDTIAVESARQWQNSYPLYLRNKMPKYERPKMERTDNLTPSIVVDQKMMGVTSRSTVGTAIDVSPLLRLLFSRVGQPPAGGAMAYSFNHPLGMCPDCTGLGERMELIEERMFDPDKTLNGGAIQFSQFQSGWQSILYQNNPYLNADKRLGEFSDGEWKILKYGTDEKLKIEIRSPNTGRIDFVCYEGVVPRFRRLYIRRDITQLKKKLQDEIFTFVRKGPCSTCNGAGLNPRALASKINGHNMVELMDLPMADLMLPLADIQDPRGASLAGQISTYIDRMNRVGLGYLSLSRRTETLSGGEMQRIKMVRHLGSCLSNITYIFDEPTAGLHPHDAQRIGRLLLDLRDRHNNVLVVEHSRQMVELADHIIEVGPGAGAAGGSIVFAGTVEDLKKADTLTARSIGEKVRVNRQPLSWSESYVVEDAHCHNLKHIRIEIPKGLLTAITGVAGSGKSSLACCDFREYYPEAIVIDQRPIGTSIRSTPATYTGAMDEIRRVFAGANGVDVGWFSFNSKGGCLACKGTGQIVYEMAFAEPVIIGCEECQGRRYNPVALGYCYGGLNIEEVMALTIEKAVEVFADRKIRKVLRGLLDVGLGYLTLGQPTSTLSGGEVQRVKLASELHRWGNIYILDEPTNGLHGRDVEKLLQLLRKIVANGNTVVIVEHRLEMIAQTDWVIDMGPGGGSEGGEVLFAGVPEDLIRCGNSKTAEFLRSVAE